MIPAIAELTSYSKALSGLTPEQETLLIDIGEEVKPHLQEITEQFYAKLQQIPQAAPFLEGKVEHLKKTHLQWLHSLFSGPYDVDYAERMYKVGDVHVKVKLPVEFMAGGITLIKQGLIDILNRLYAENINAKDAAISAVNAVLGFSLIIMQQSYQASTLHEELEKFLKISGMSRVLFSNLAKAYKD